METPAALRPSYSRAVVDWRVDETGNHGDNPANAVVGRTWEKPGRGWFGGYPEDEIEPLSV